MLMHRSLYDPVRRTDEMEVREFTKYVDIRNAQKKTTPDELFEEVRNQFYDYHKRYGRQVLDPVWNGVASFIHENEGLAQFILDYDGAVSDFFFPWLIAVHASPSMALEMAYGEGFDIMGRWRVAGDDEIDYFVRNDPTFVYNRERQLFVANLATFIREDVRPYNTKTKIVDLGAGRMAWARWHGFEFFPAVQSILAFDIDSTIEPEELFPDGDLAEYGITYQRADIRGALKRSECQDANLVILGGVASYFPMKVFKEQIVKPAYETLHDGGVFFFDLQLDCPYYRRSMAIFNWPKMELREFATDAVEEVEVMRRELWKEGLKFKADYAFDTYNEFPTSVLVTLTKI